MTVEKSGAGASADQSSEDIHQYLSQAFSQLTQWKKAVEAVLQGNCQIAVDAIYMQKRFLLAWLADVARSSESSDFTRDPLHDVPIEDLVEQLQDTFTALLPVGDEFFQAYLASTDRVLEWTLNQVESPMAGHRPATRSSDGHADPGIGDQLGSLDAMSQSLSDIRLPDGLKTPFSRWLAEGRQFLDSYRRYVSLQTACGKEAAELFHDTVGKLSKRSESFGSTAELFSLWNRCCEKVSNELVRSEDYAVLFTQLCNTYTEWYSAHQDLLAHSGSSAVE